MATPGQLVKTLADALGIPEATVSYYDRNLVAAGLRSKHGRGRGAARVTARDAAALLTAILASARTLDSVHSVHRYGETRAQPAKSSTDHFAALGIAELSNLSPDHSFIDALAALIDAAASQSWVQAMQSQADTTDAHRAVAPPRIDVTALTPNTFAEIRISGFGQGGVRSVRYSMPDPWQHGHEPSPSEMESWAAKVRQDRPDIDLEQQRRVSERTILTVAALLATTQKA